MNDVINIPTTTSVNVSYGNGVVRIGRKLEYNYIPYEQFMQIAEDVREAHEMEKNNAK